MPKFKAEVKKMILSVLPSKIAGYFEPNNDQAWRFNGHPDVFLSRADNIKCDNSRIHESNYSLISRTPVLQKDVKNNAKPSIIATPPTSSPTILKR